MTTTHLPPIIDGQQRRRMDDVMTLERLEPSLFRTAPQAGPSARIFGGEVAAQAVMAAAATVDPDREVHSVHAYYLLPGDTSKPVVYKVETQRDGGSFSNRTVSALQDGHVIFTLGASFQTARVGLEHQVPQLDAPSPEQLSPPSVTFADDPGTASWLDGLAQRIPVELRFPSAFRRERGTDGRASIRTWMRSAEALPGDSLTHAASTVYLSDLFMLSTALIPHGHRIDDGSVQFATVDHSVWLHGRCRADEWFMYEIESDWTGSGRALCRGRMFDRDGRLFASTVQEGTIRVI